MTKIAVYRYEISDRRTATPAQAARMATAEAIRREKGSAILESQCFVESSDIDSDGFARDGAVGDSISVEPGRSDG